MTSVWANICDTVAAKHSNIPNNIKLITYIYEMPQAISILREQLKCVLETYFQFTHRKKRWIFKDFRFTDPSKQMSSSAR